MKTNIELMKNIAPTLATALQGPFIGVASKFILDNLAENKIDETRPKDDIIAELLNNTNNLKKLKTLDEQFKLELKELNIDVFALKNIDNTKSLKVEKSNIVPQTIISSLFLVAYFALLGAIFYVEVSDSLNMNKGENSLMGEFQILFGVLTAGVGQIFGFWFSASPQTKKSKVAE